MNVEVNGQELTLLRERAVWWKKRSTLLIADVHFGKVSHFRKNGVHVPNKAAVNNYWKLSALIQDTGADRVLFLGDLFHSRRNHEWDHLHDFLLNFAHVDFVLIRGNHDVVEREKIAELPMAFHEESLNEEGFVFSHDSLETPNGDYNIYGHIHPAVRLSGRGRQSLKLPCFYFGERSAILPAFGDFTGLHPIKPLEGDRVYVPLDDSVMQVC